MSEDNPLSCPSSAFLSIRSATSCVLKPLAPPDQRTVTDIRSFLAAVVLTLLVT